MCHFQVSVTLICKQTLRNKIIHSPSISSSHTHNRLLHLQPSPPSSHPLENICATVMDLSTASSNRRLKRTQNGTAPNHTSCQNKVSAPSPTSRHIPSWNHPPPTPPKPSLILAISHHQEEPLRPPTANLPASSPYRATNTLYQKHPLSSNNLQYHLPNKARLNSLNRLTPNPPPSLDKQTKLQAKNVRSNANKKWMTSNVRLHF